MPASVTSVVGLRPVSYLCGGLAPRFLFFSSDFLLARNIEKPTTTHQPTTRPLQAILWAKHYEGIVLHGQGPGPINLWRSTSLTRTAAARVRCQIRVGGYPG